MAAIADVIAVGELQAEIGETDRNGTSEIRFLLRNARFIRGEPAALSDPFAPQPSDVVFAAQIREEPGTRSLDQSLFRILEGKSVIVFLRRRDAALECVDAWFSIHPYNPRLEEEIKRAE